MAAAHIQTSPAHRTSHLQVTCHVHLGSANNSTDCTVPSQTKLNSSASSQQPTCLCTLLNMLNPINSANALIDLLIALQNNTIINSLTHNVPMNQNASLNNGQNYFGNNDSHGSGTSLNSNNSFLMTGNSGTLNRQTPQSNNLSLSNGRCHQPSIGGSIV